MSIGDRNDIFVGNGNNRIVFTGDYTDIEAGNGTNTIKTLDFAIMDGDGDGVYEEYEEYLKDQVSTRKEDGKNKLVFKGVDHVTINNENSNNVMKLNVANDLDIKSKNGKNYIIETGEIVVE